MVQFCLRVIKIGHLCVMGWGLKNVGECVSVCSWSLVPCSALVFDSWLSLSSCFQFVGL